VTDKEQQHDWQVGSDGFFIRGAEMTRLETFVDAAFAFSVTLLVVGGGDNIPSTYDDFIQAMKQVPAFLACFANVMFFWYAHYRWSRRFGLEDLRSTLLSLALIFVVLVYVYPLKAVYSGAFEFFSGGYLKSFFTLSGVDDLRIMFIIFGVGYAMMSCLIAALDAHARSVRDEIALTPVEYHDAGTSIGIWLVSAGVALVSVVLSIVLPENLIAVAGMSYAALGIVVPAVAAPRYKRREAIIERNKD